MSQTLCILVNQLLIHLRNFHTTLQFFSLQKLQISINRLRNLLFVFLDLLYSQLILYIDFIPFHRIMIRDHENLYSFYQYQKMLCPLKETSLTFPNNSQGVHAV